MLGVLEQDQLTTLLRGIQGPAAVLCVNSVQPRQAPLSTEEGNAATAAAAGDGNLCSLFMKDSQKLTGMCFVHPASTDVADGNGNAELALSVSTEHGTVSLGCILANDAAVRELRLRSHQDVLYFLADSFSRDGGLGTLFFDIAMRLLSGRLTSVKHFVPGAFGNERYFLSMRVSPFACPASTPAAASPFQTEGEPAAAAAAADGSGAGSSVFRGGALPALILELDVPYEGKELAARLQRDYMIISNIPSIVTMFDMDGRVLHQNHASIAFMGALAGRRMAPAAVAAPASAEGASPAEAAQRQAPCAAGGGSVDLPDTDVFQALFSLEPTKGEEAARAVMNGEEWQGVVLVPPNLRRLLAAAAPAAPADRVGAGATAAAAAAAPNDHGGPSRRCATSAFAAHVPAAPGWAAAAGASPFPSVSPPWPSLMGRSERLQRDSESTAAVATVAAAQMTTNRVKAAVGRKSRHGLQRATTPAGSHIPIQVDAGTAAEGGGSGGPTGAGQIGGVSPLRGYGRARGDDGVTETAFAGGMAAVEAPNAYEDADAGLTTSARGAPEPPAPTTTRRGGSAADAAAAAAPTATAAAATGPSSRSGGPAAVAAAPQRRLAPPSSQQQSAVVAAGLPYPMHPPWVTSDQLTPLPLQPLQPLPRTQQQHRWHDADRLCTSASLGAANKAGSGGVAPNNVYGSARLPLDTASRAAWPSPNPSSVGPWELSQGDRRPASSLALGGGGAGAGGQPGSAASVVALQRTDSDWGLESADPFGGPALDPAGGGRIATLTLTGSICTQLDTTFSLDLEQNRAPQPHQQSRSQSQPPQQLPASQAQPPAQQKQRHLQPPQAQPSQASQAQQQVKQQVQQQLRPRGLHHSESSNGVAMLQPHALLTTLESTIRSISFDGVSTGGMGSGSLVGACSTSTRAQGSEVAIGGGGSAAAAATLAAVAAAAAGGGGEAAGSPGGHLFEHRRPVAVPAAAAAAPAAVSSGAMTEASEWSLPLRSLEGGVVPCSQLGEGGASSGASAAAATCPASGGGDAGGGGGSSSQASSNVDLSTGAADSTALNAASAAAAAAAVAAPGPAFSTAAATPAAAAADASSLVAVAAAAAEEEDDAGRELSLALPLDAAGGHKTPARTSLMVLRPSAASMSFGGSCGDIATATALGGDFFSALPGSDSIAPSAGPADRQLTSLPAPSEIGSLASLPDTDEPGVTATGVIDTATAITSAAAHRERPPPPPPPPALQLPLLLPSPSSPPQQQLQSPPQSPLLSPLLPSTGSLPPVAPVAPSPGTNDGLNTDAADTTTPIITTPPLYTAVASAATPHRRVTELRSIGTARLPINPQLARQASLRAVSARPAAAATAAANARSVPNVPMAIPRSCQPSAAAMFPPGGASSPESRISSCPYASVEAVVSGSRSRGRSRSQVLCSGARTGGGEATFSGDAGWPSGAAAGAAVAASASATASLPTRRRRALMSLLSTTMGGHVARRTLVSTQDLANLLDSLAEVGRSRVGRAAADGEETCSVSGILGGGGGSRGGGLLAAAAAAAAAEAAPTAAAPRGVGGGGVAGLAPGECRWHQVLVRPCAEPQSDRRVVLVVQTDVTSQVRAESALVEALEAQYRLLADILPRHVVTHMMASRREELETEMGTEMGMLTRTRMPAQAALDGEQEQLLQQPVSTAGLHSLRRRITDTAALATSHDCITVLFADIKGFTEMSKAVPPAVVMTFLNDLYTRFDSLTDVYGVYKVETIGDCYMVAGGLVSRDGDGYGRAVRGQGDTDPLHAMRVVAFARAMLEEAAKVALPNTGEPVQVRIGVHSGPATSGVVGTKMPRFCLFGDTINTASRMESTGRPGAIHVSCSTRQLLPPEEDEQLWAATGGVEVKGKGRMDTFFWSPHTTAARRQRSHRHRRAMLLGTLSSLHSVPEWARPEGLPPTASAAAEAAAAVQPQRVDPRVAGAAGGSRDDRSRRGSLDIYPAAYSPRA